VKPRVVPKARQSVPAPTECAGSGHALDCSDFVAEVQAANPQWLVRLQKRSAPQFAGALAVPRATPALLARGEAEFMRRLRIWRREELARIAWRDLCGWAEVPEILRELSAAADAAIRQALAFAREMLRPRFGLPRNQRGAEVPFIVLGMGKLGGHELNFSSDIDLVFLYAEHGDSDGAQSLANEDYFTRLGQMLIRLLDQRTEDGFVYRVDMRLRPFGDSGPLVASFDALEDYLQSQGRDWERYAWVKARAVTGTDAYAGLFANVVRPFVYRRYLDFGVFESLREMKAMIGREVERRELHDNVKLGPGGIREIEFAVQAMQLIRGGQDRRLQGNSLLEILPRLRGGRLMPAAAVDGLRNAYLYLRRLENRLQMMRDQQTHSLPADQETQARIARAMGHQKWSALRQELDAHRAIVSRHFAALLFGESGDSGAAARDSAAGNALSGWADAGATPEQRVQALHEQGIAHAVDIASLLTDLAGSSLLRRLDETGRRRLVQLVPVLVAEVAATAAPVEALRRLLRVIESIGQRSAYFSLLLENVGARRRLVELASHGEFLTQQVATYPVLLDELIDASLYDDALPGRAALAADLDARMLQLEPGDEEAELDQLRHFQRIALFRVAVADVTGRLPLMRVSDRLTDIAEVIVARAMALAWQQVTRQSGVPCCGKGRARREVRLCAVGYGKLGGQELSYSSDLDLVFLHDSSGDDQETRGAKPIDNQVFFVRYVQRLIHLLSFHSAAGRLYEVDMRLRPSGKGGMLITQVDAFADYQRKEAWTWEHQSLLHARAVAGDAGQCARFEILRTALLQDAIHRDRLRAEVRDMRQRQRRELSRAGAEEFDVKQDPGGVADIEFLAQYWALRWAKEFPPVAMFADTIRQLESVASADLRPQATVDVLTNAYRVYRACLHHRALDGKGAVIAAHEFRSEREAVQAIWQADMDVVEE
jgi:glutamate-ammonia-ligase adenylyltransferase